MHSSSIKELQQKILEIVQYFDSFCKNNNIEYYLMGGSAIGALRHKGFIPWDDDLDVFMTYDNYKKFNLLAGKYIDTINFHLQKENTDEWPMYYSKLRMNGTTFIEEDTINSEMHQGVFIDIMCLYNVSSNVLIRYVQYISARILVAKSLSLRGYNTKGSFFKKAVLKFSKLFVRGPFEKLLLKIVHAYNCNNTKLVGHFFGKAPFRKTSFPKEWLSKPRYTPFENTVLPVPQKCENYLELRFGDFMKIPDEATKAKYPIHAFFVDVNNDYKLYKNTFKQKK